MAGGAIHCSFANKKLISNLTEVNPVVGMFP
jgi:hypothetical protein